MTQNLQVSKRLDDGTILVVGGDTVAEFAANLTAIGGETLRDGVRELFRTLSPVSAGHPAPQQAPPQQAPQADPFGQAQQNVQAAFPQAQPVSQYPQQQLNSYREPAGPPPAQQAPLCPNHQQPAKWVAPGVSGKTGKPYNGFWSCNAGDRNCKIRD